MSDKIMNNENVESPSLEELFAQLEGLIDNIQSNNLSLEETFSKYKTGLELVEQCSKKIDKIECDIKLLKPQGE